MISQRNPVYTAKETTTLDILSGGRLDLGIGVGWLREEMEEVLQDIYGRALKKRAAEMGEITSIQEREVDGEIELTIKVEV